VEVAFGGGEVEPVGGGELARDEAGEEGFVLEAEDFVGEFHGGAGGVGEVGVEGGDDGIEACGGEDFADEIGHGEGFAVGDEVGFAGAGGGLGKVFGGEEVGVGGVVDVGGIDEIFSAADHGEAADAGAGEDAWDEVRIAGAPDEMRAEGNGGEVGRVGGEDEFFGDGFGFGIVGEVAFGIGGGFGDAVFAGAIEDDAGGAGEDEAGDAGLAAGGENVLGADDVGGVKVGVGSPDAGPGGDVEEDVDSFGGRGESGGVGEVALDGFDV